MKHLLVFVFVASILSCKNNPKNSNEISGDLTTIKGNYIFFEDAAVLQNDSEIYGVILNDLAKELNEKAAKYKTSNNDNVNVEVTGIISTKKDDIILWENKIEIIDIIAISSANDTNNTLKSGIK